DKLTDGDDAPVMVGGAPLDVADLVGETEALAIDPALAGSTSDGCSAHTESHGGCHGRVHQAVRQSAGVCLPLLRPHCHSRLPQRPVTARAGGALRPQSRRRSRGQQGDLEPAYRRLSELGGSLRPQPSHPHRVGREGCSQGRPCPALAAPNNEQERLRRLFHLQEHGAGVNFSHQHAEISHPRTTASLHASAAASPTITSTSAMKLLAPWSCAWPRSSPSKRPTTSMATASSSRSSTARKSASARTTMPSWPLMTWLRCRLPLTGGARASSASGSTIGPSC